MSSQAPSIDGPDEVERVAELLRRARAAMEGFKDADLIIENTYTPPNVHQVYLEPHNQVTTIDDNGVMHVWAPCKAPYSARKQTALALGLQPEQIVFHPVTIGGDFGGLELGLHAADRRATRRPVPIEEATADGAVRVARGTQRHHRQAGERGQKQSHTLNTHR